MSNKTEWESDVTVMLGHAIAIPGHAKVWSDHESWGGTVTFQAFAAVRSPEVVELDIPGASRHMVDVLRMTSGGEKSGTATTLRFKGRGALPAPRPSAKEPETDPPVAVPAA